MNASELTRAYDAVINATDETFKAAEKYEQAKEELETNILLATAKGDIAGKNEGERKAVAIAMFADKHAEVEALRMVYKINANKLDIAKLHLACLRDLLRIEELVK
jgi:uncharacterized Ntn-hydrolase superfamily protein